MLASKFTLFYAIILHCLIFTKSETLKEDVSIIIVGAGPSGIAAATKLLKSNFSNIKILEAGDRIGGRVNSVKLGDSFIDLGAQFCHGEKDNIVYQMVKELNVLKHSSNGVEVVLSNGKKLEPGAQSKILNFEQSVEALEIDDYSKKVCENLTSFEDCFNLKYDNMLKETTDEKEKTLLQEAKLWLRNYVSVYHTNIDDLSQKSDLRKCEGDLFMNWNGKGYKTILEVMMGKFPNPKNTLPIDDKILLNKEVVNIKNWEEGNQVEVSTKSGEMFKANHVILTPSVGVLKAKYETLFDPPLPEDKIHAIKGIGYGAILKIILKFREPSNKSYLLGIIWSQEDLEEAEKKGFGWLKYLTAIVTAANNPNVLICFYAGGNATDIEKLEDDQVLEGQKHLATKLLTPVFGVSEPEEIIRTSWHSNPHFRGTNSYESVEGYRKYGDRLPEKLAKSLLNKDQKSTVMFAGEATHPYYFSTVHGAIETGYREADKLIKYYSDKN